MNNDVVNRPAHYTDGKIEVIDFIEDKGLNFHRGNAVKYIARAGKKDPAKEVEDLEKARWYINREIERLKGSKASESARPEKHEAARYGCETCKHRESDLKSEPCISCHNWSKVEPINCESCKFAAFTEDGKRTCCHMLTCHAFSKWRAKDK